MKSSIARPAGHALYRTAPPQARVVLGYVLGLACLFFWNPRVLAQELESPADPSSVLATRQDQITAPATLSPPAPSTLEPDSTATNGQAALAASAPQHLPDGMVLMNFRNASLDAVLAFLSEAGGLTVLNDQKIEGRVNVLNRQPMTLEEALEVLDTLLKDRGLAAVRTGKTLKIMPLESAKKAAIPVRQGNNPADIPETDQMITQVIPVRFADAVALRRDLAPLIPAYAELAANASTNTLILTDTSSGVRRIVEIIRSMDTTVAAVNRVRVFNLKYANASSAARLITEVFQQDQTGQRGQQAGQFGGAFARFLAGAGGQPAGAASGGRGGPSGFSGTQGGPSGADASGEVGRPQSKVTASADDRTNTLVISAPVDLMDTIAQVLEEIDANPAQDQAVFTYYLRNAQAANVESIINSLFGTSASGRATPTRTGTPGTPGSSGTTGTRTGTTGSAFSSNMNLAQVGASTGGTGGGATRAASGAAASGRVSSGAAQTAADLAGQVYAVADTSTNSLLVMTASGNFERVQQVLGELDRPIPQVLIKVLIAEVTHDNDTDLGVEFSAINLKNSGKSTVFTDFGVASASGGLVYKLVEADVTVALRALEKVGKLDVLSRPYILTSDNQTASIIVGQRVPFITNTRTTDTGQTINTIQYEDIGIILNVTPHINPDGLVILDVAPEISSQTGNSVPISETVNAPVFAKRAAQTRVSIHDGKTIVIGGLMEDRKTQTTRKVPVLGDIPLLGALLSRDETKKSKTELLIFLTPHVAETPDMLSAMSDSERQGAVIVPRAVDQGVFEEHMQGMERGASSSGTSATERPPTPNLASEPAPRTRPRPNLPHRVR